MADGRTLYVILSANAAAYKTAMRGSASETRDFGREVDETGRKIDRTSAKTERMGKEVDKLSGRLRIALDVLALIGPAAVPLAAVALPALTGMASQAALLAVSGGAAMLALNGTVDALKAIEEARLDPSAANLQKMHEALEKMPADARAFVAEVDSMRPMLDQLQDAAASGLFGPGGLDNIGRLRNMLTPVSRLVEESANSLGHMASEGIDAFDSKRGREFVRFLRQEVRPGVTDMLSTIGNLAGGLGELWMGFQPVNNDFGDWLLEQSRDFKTWAREIDETDSYEAFIDYIRENGPEVADALGSIGDMTVQLVQAAAPMGGPALQGITLFADAVAKILDSPIGPSLIAGAGAAALLNRSLQLTTSLLGKIGVQSAANGTISGAGIVGGLEKRAWGAAAGVQNLGQRLRYAGQSAEYASERTLRAREATAGYAKAAGGAAAGIAAVAVLSTEQGRALGLNNTALLGLTGSMLGPFGAAGGATVGLLLDLVSASKNATATLDGLDKAVEGTDWTSMREQIAASRAELEDLRNVDTSKPGDIFEKMGSDLRGVWNGDFSWEGSVERTAEYERELAKLEERSQAVATAQVTLGKELGVLNPELSYAGATTDEWRRTLERAQPAMDALGISAEDLYNMDSSEVGVAADRIREWIRNADSGKGRVEAFATSVHGLADDFLSTADSAEVMGAALEALLGPALGAEAATDAWHASLKTLRQELKAGMGFEGYKKGAVENRQVTRDYADASIQRLKALAGVTGTTQKDMARAVASTRREFIESAVAAGLDREAVIKRANALGLTPKLVRTVFEAAGITETELKARELADNIKKIPPKVRTLIATEGIPKSKAAIDELVEKYELTEQQRTALVSIKDLASADIEGVIALLEQTAGSKPNPDVSANTAPARAALEDLLAFLRGVDGTTATTTVYTKRVTIGGAQPSSPGEPTPPRMPTQPSGGGGGGGGGGDLPDRNGRIRSAGGGGNKPYMFNPGATLDTSRITDTTRRYSGTRLVPSAAGASSGVGGSTSYYDAPTIGNLTVPAMPGATLADVDQTAGAIVRAASFARSSGRWKRRRN